MSYLPFIRAHWRFLLFGFSLEGFSSFGQTYFIALFSGEIRGEFDLSHGDFGLYYSVATLASGFTVIWLGRKIDHIPLKRFTVYVLFGLAGACALTAATPAAIFLFLAFFALRLAGQGMMTHVAVTSMVRYFSRDRGKALAIATLGMPVYQAVLPLAVVAGIAAIGWRATYAGGGFLLLAVMLPLTFWLLRGGPPAEDVPAAPTGPGAPRRWGQRDVLRDPRFYMVMPAALAPAFIVTGFLFHQVHLVETKGWPMELWASGFAAYAGASLLATLIVGPLIDRFSATVLLPFYLPVLAIALLSLALSDDPAIIFVFMGATGVTTGFSMAIIGALWAEVYGVHTIGSIRALSSALMVLASALSPGIMGWMIDTGVTMEEMAWMALVYVGLGTVLLALASVSIRRSL
ncbi:MAG: MFS transporter [Rhodospirillaceae bacterium]|nr:MFS transporter [Rhodospirillaceae bacterium]MBT6119308.1 MFS transporter [Rhodospirillaceae bacterium]